MLWLAGVDGDGEQRRSLMVVQGQTVDQYDVIIIGAGPAGLCAGMYAGRGMLRTLVLERGLPGGELLNTELIEDYIGFESIPGRELAERMTRHALKFGAEIVTDTVEAVRKTDEGDFTVETALGKRYRAPAVILTAGGTPNKLGVPGEQEYAGRGVSYCAVCDGAFFKQETIAVVGGGDAAVEEADYLTRYAAKVYIVHRRDQLRASPIIQERALKNPKIEVIWNKVVEEILGGPMGVMSLRLRDTVTGDTSSTLAVTGCFVFIGFSPNTGMIKGHYDHDASGYVKTDTHMRTSIPGLFAAGDLRVQLTRQVTTAVGDATTAAIAVQKYLTELRERESAGVAAT
jgi:thioredoxin reductase (NADPH)